MFLQSPDIFELAIPENMKGISILPFESEWGVTDELLCYYENTLIGLVATKIAKPYYLGQKTLFIYLLPKTDRRRNYPRPSYSDFLSALTSLLNEGLVWDLHCEYDCEQYPVVNIEENLPETIKELESALLYSAGNTQVCPTFCAKRGYG
ncbi:MAG: hypothetical protein V4732_12860 [Pseudomonadota bacterium]